LAFASATDAETAARQHLCLCRNEDVVLPREIQLLAKAAFDALDGFELRFEDGPTDTAFLVGFNRFAANAPMYGSLTVSGRAVRHLPQ